MSEENLEPILNSFHPQAYLMFLNFFSSNSLKKSNISNVSAPTGVHKLTGDYRPESVMSKVYNSRDSKGKKLIKAHFFNLETHKLSTLIPELRFYKTDGVRYTPFFFPISTISDEAATMQGNSRTKGSGIKDFNVTFEGTDPYTAPKFLSANLSLYVDNLANIFDHEKGYSPLADLFTISIAKNAKKKGKNGATVTSGDFVRPIEVAATLGYSIPDTTVFTQEEIKEIQDSNLSLRMNVIKHEIDVNQDGSATIKIDYTARIDNSARDKIFSATDNPIDLLKRANIRQLFAPEKKKIDSTDKKKDQLKAESSARRSQIQKAIEIRKILDILEREKKIHFIDTEEEKLKAYIGLGVDSVVKDQEEPQSAPKTPEEKLLAKKVETLKRRLGDIDDSKRRVYYVTFGDLISAFFEKTRRGLLDALGLLTAASSLRVNIADQDELGLQKLEKDLRVNRSELSDIAAFAYKSKDEKDKIEETILGAIQKLSTYRVLLADVEYKRYKTGSKEEETQRINIADIPVSLEVYQEFMFDKIVNSYRNTYTIPQFLNDCISHLLPNALGSIWAVTGIAPRVVSTSPKFTSTVFSAPELRRSMAKRKEIIPEDIPSPQKDFRASNISDECDYFMIYPVADRRLASDRAGSKEKDSRDGIYHFQIGKNTGLIKEIKFSRFDVPFAQEQLMTNQVGLYDELKMPYTANITMFGNNLFHPGSQIFINPNNIGFGSATDLNSPAFRIGLGGYYTVINVSTGVRDGVMSTTLGCSFGSHASDAEGLTAAHPKPQPLDEVDRAQASNDNVAGPEGDLNTSLVEVSQSHYLSQLQSIEDPATGERILDAPLANSIANDYILHQESNMGVIPGVLDKSTNPQTGAVRYNLVRGQIIEIDDSVPMEKSVKLVNSSTELNTRSRANTY